jgi:hypothetical protein
MLGNAFPAKIAAASRAPDDRFPVLMDAASLKYEVHIQLCPCAFRISGSIRSIPL